MVTQVEFHLYRHADTAWRAVVRPWLETGRGRLERAYVVVATRGQAHGLKQRCLMEGVPLLGVEFLTPGLARKKWAARHEEQRPAIGRELLLLGLRTLVARRLAPLAAGDAAWGFWKSLQSDPARALDDFDELLKAGFGAADFPLAPWREIAVELTAWVAARGYALAALEAKRAGAAPLADDAPSLGGRVLVWGLGAELGGEFFNVAAFVRRCADVTAVLPEPEFRGRADCDERWIELWGELLGADPLPLDAAPPAETCEAVGALWLHEPVADRRGDPAGGQGPPRRSDVRLIVGRTRGDEMRLVADAIGAMLGAGAENLAAIFPRADAAHLELATLLAERGVPFSDLLETAGPPPVEVQAQRALLEFYAQGARLEELLALWPWLRAIGATTLSPAEARRAAERSFDARQSHAVAAHLAEWSGRAPELARVADALLPPWPDPLPLAEALQRFRAACGALELEPPEGWGALDAFARRDAEPVPLAAAVTTLASFLPAAYPVETAPGRGGFARVTLTTRRRAEGLDWSHLILVESNAGVWPERRDASCWLTDADRRELNAQGRGLQGLLTVDERAALERAGYAALTRDTRTQVIFSAALFAPEDPEVKLAPNSWVERVMWAQGAVDDDGDMEAAFDRLALAVAPLPEADPGRLGQWQSLWAGRRDPMRPFDEFFFAGDAARIAPAKLSAKLIERGVQDPAELWFEAVLGVRRVGWEPFARTRRKALGQRAHELLAVALQPGDAVGRGFGTMPSPTDAAAKLDRALAILRAQWPADCYWDSFAAELGQVSRALLENVYAIDAGGYGATEVWLPAKAHLDLGGHALPIVGRMDLVRLDRPDWPGARVDIIDFKTGGDTELSAERMARSGASLQLGVYLQAARSLGAADGKVWMIKPEPGAITSLALADLGLALGKLNWLETALARGVYGALTRDRSDYAPDGFAWPLACVPVPQAVLAEKFARTFGGEAAGDE